MKINSLTAAWLLVGSGFVAAQAFAQGAPAKAAEAQRLQQLKAQRDARIAAAKAQQNQIQRPTATPNPPPPPTTTPTAPPTIAIPTTRPTATAAPTTTPTTATTAAATATATASATTSAKATTPPTTSATPASAASVAPPAAPPSGLDLEELKKSRPDRRKAEFGQLQARWGELLRDQRASSELKLHAQRVAYLQRIRALATKANDAKTVQAVDVLITKEETRSADAMNALRSGALPAVAAGGTK